MFETVALATRRTGGLTRLPVGNTPYPCTGVHAGPELLNHRTPIVPSRPATPRAQGRKKKRRRSRAFFGIDRAGKPWLHGRADRRYGEDGERPMPSWACVWFLRCKVCTPCRRLCGYEPFHALSCPCLHLEQIGPPQRKRLRELERLGPLQTPIYRRGGVDAYLPLRRAAYARVCVAA